MTRVNETRTRSILKGITGRILEVILDMLLINLIGMGKIDIQTSFIIAVIIEAVCFIASYINERFWNLTDFGRTVKDG